MEKQPLLISVSGMYRTGSSAVIDLLREYEELQIVNGEFKPFEAGLYKLLDKLTQGVTLSENEVLQIEKGTLGYGRKAHLLIRVLRKLNNLFGTKILIEKGKNNRGYKELFPSYSKSTKHLFESIKIINRAIRDSGHQDSKQREYLIKALESFFMDLLVDYNLGMRTPVFDQLIKAERLFLADLMPNAKIICVMRDPRDQFCDIIATPDKKPSFSNPRRVDNFITEYKKRYSNATINLENAPGNVLKIQFEDLVYRNKTTTRNIEKHLQLQSSSNSFYGKFFDRKKAADNVMRYKFHPHPEEIYLIEKSLSEWMYPFPESF